MLGSRTFRFLNETRELSFPGGWNEPGADKLWLYNLHYFEDLAAEGAAERTEWHHDLIDTWIVGNPPFEGNGWDPYPVSLRIGYWIKWALAGNELDETWLRSLALQAEYLSRRVEWHLLGNHVFENARALIMAGMFFEGAQAENWLSQGLRIMDGQLAEQILEDGGHFERSPMYHALVLEGLLDLVQVSENFERNRQQALAWREYAARMLAWLDTMSHPDGQISFFNDAAFDVALSPEVLFDYAQRLKISDFRKHKGDGIVFLEDSGYIRVDRGPFALLLDVAPVGPDYQPGHAHADTLSFELSIFGKRVLVNSGTSVYGVGEERLRQRGTAAHNTIVVDEQDSSEVWSGFRVGRRAHAFDVSIRGFGESWEVQASHDGFRRLASAVTHSRTLVLSDSRLTIRDEISGASQTVNGYYHFHPDLCVSVRGLSVVLTDQDDNRVGELTTETAATLTDSTWHPEFGRTITNRRMQVSFHGHSFVVVFRPD